VAESEASMASARLALKQSLYAKKEMQLNVLANTAVNGISWRWLASLMSNSNAYGGVNES